jgi:hypothetical protein
MPTNARLPSDADDSVEFLAEILMRDGFVSLTVQARAWKDPEFQRVIEKYRVEPSVATEINEQIRILPAGHVALIAGLRIEGSPDSAQASSLSPVAESPVRADPWSIYETVARWKRRDGLSHEAAVQRCAKQTGVGTRQIEHDYARGLKRDPTIERPNDPKVRIAYRQVKALLKAGHRKRDAVALVAERCQLTESTVANSYARMRAVDPFRLEDLRMKKARPIASSVPA